MSKKAFTLIELLVVIAVIGILSGLIVVSMGGITTKANIAKLQVFSNSIKNSLMSDFVAEYRLDGNMTDTWSNGITGSLTGNTTYSSDCASGQCLYFDGSGDLATIPDSTSLQFGTSNFTISFWVKSGTFVNNAGLIAKDTAADLYGLRINSTGGAVTGVLRANGGTVFYPTMPGALIANEWTLITMTVNRTGNAIVYKNTTAGVPVNISVDSTRNISPAINLIIGYTNGNMSPAYHNGYIDDIRFYRNVLTLSEIKERYFSGIKNLLTSNQLTEQEYSDKIKEIGYGN